MTQKQVSTKKPAMLDDDYQKEIEKAALRVGQDYFEGLAWLVRFAQSDLDTLSQGELIDLGYELNCLADFRYTTKKTGELLGSIKFSLQDWEGRQRFRGKSGEIDLAEIVAAGNHPGCPPMNRPSLDQIKDLQQSVIKPLSDLLQSGGFGLELPQVFVNAFTDKESDVVMVFTKGDRPQDLFAYNLTFLLIKGACRIRRCPECQRIFAADRKNKMSCSARCQNTAAVRRLRQSASNPKHKQGKIPKSSKKPKG